MIEPPVTLTVYEAPLDPDRFRFEYPKMPDVFVPAFTALADDIDGSATCVCGEPVAWRFTDDDIDGVATGVVRWYACLFITDGVTILVVCEDCDPRPATWPKFTQPVPEGAPA